MASLNKVFLIGNLTKDPVVRKMPSGEDVAEMRLAVNRKFRDRSGKDREETLFINVTVYGSRASVVGRYLRSGSPVLIEGRLKYDEWTDREGKRQNRISVVADNFEFIGGGAASSRAAAESEPEAVADAGPDAANGGQTGGRPAGGARGPDEGATPWRGGAGPEESREDSDLPF